MKEWRVATWRAPSRRRVKTKPTGNYTRRRDGAHYVTTVDLCVIKTLYIIRHGQTDLNLRRIVQGSGVDAPLNATGHAQAAAFFRAFGHVPFDRVYTSALQRAIESVRGFLDCGIPHIATAALNEISWGRFEGLEATSEQHGQYLSAVDRWAAP